MGMDWPRPWRTSLESSIGSWFCATSTGGRNASCAGRSKVGCASRRARKPHWPRSPTVSVAKLWRRLQSPLGPTPFSAGSVSWWRASSTGRSSGARSVGPGWTKRWKTWWFKWHRRWVMTASSEPLRTWAAICQTGRWAIFCGHGISPAPQGKQTTRWRDFVSSVSVPTEYLTLPGPHSPCSASGLLVIRELTRKTFRDDTALEDWFC